MIALDPMLQTQDDRPNHMLAQKFPNRTYGLLMNKQNIFVMEYNFTKTDPVSETTFKKLENHTSNSTSTDPIVNTPVYMIIRKCYKINQNYCTTVSQSCVW